MNQDKSHNKVAVVTGGSKGIGRAIVLALAQRGYDVAIFDPLAAGREVAQEATALGRRALYLPVDVSDETAVKQAAQSVAAELGSCGLLVNNAGIFPRASALEMPFALWQKVLAINLG
jgi:meso-butanediol dehydrogenase/(S,S)-butanediol dehydrogenase/diacetyl reductase